MDTLARASNCRGTAQHLETDFYDKYYEPGSYHETIRKHMETWHGD